MIKPDHRFLPIIVLLVLFASSTVQQPALALNQSRPFLPGENLKYQLHWENVPAGEIELEVKSIESINGTLAYHFVMTTKTSSFVDFFYKIRERIDAYADANMIHSIFYTKKQIAGSHKRDEKIEFDWQAGSAQYTNFDKKRRPIDLLPGSFDPLSAFYYMRMAISHENSQMSRPVTNGKKNFMGNAKAKVIQREVITLSNGKRYDTYCLEPDIGLLGEKTKENKEAKFHIWITADDKRIPVRFTSQVPVGHFVGELASAKL